MPTKVQYIVPRFGPEVGFEVPQPTFRAAQTNTLDQLKERLLREAVAQTESAEDNSHLRRAANDAATLAWATGYPLLFFPALFAELGQTARRQNARQEVVRRRSARLMQEAA